MLVLLLGILTLIGLPFGITLWAWVKLLIVPAVIAAGGLWFNRQQRERELEVARQQRDQEVELAERRTQDETLQAYLDQMSDMLLPTKDQPSLYKAQPGDSLSTVARARTLTVLTRLEGLRKRSVVQFLYESGLIARERTLVDLTGADLRRAYLHMARMPGGNLRGADLSEANLEGTDLTRASLSGSSLREANLTEALLRRANLSRANLRRANLRGVHLEETDLREAHLSGANLSGSSLLGAHLDGTDLYKADLRDADLGEASGWTEEQLSAAQSLEGATMPDGQILKSDDNPVAPTFEEWLKSKHRGEDG